MAPMFYRNSNAALLIFDITSRTSFESIQGWVQELKRNVEDVMVLVVVGNKSDLPKREVKFQTFVINIIVSHIDITLQISRDEALQYSQSIGATYLECSARTDQVCYFVFLSVILDL